MDDNDEFECIAEYQHLQLNKDDTENKITEQHTVNNEFLDLEPVWKDDIKISDVKKTYACLDIAEVVKKDKKMKKIRSFSFLPKEKLMFPGLLDFYRCTDGNRDYSSSKHISFALCHPKKACLVTGSQDCMIGLFKIDGEENRGLTKPIYHERYPIKNGRILADGARVVYHSKFNSFRVLNLTNSKMSRYSLADKRTIIKQMEASPVGDKVVFASKDGLVHVVSTATFDVVDQLQVSSTVRSMAFSHGGRFLYVLASDGAVFVYESAEGTSRVVFKRRWNDHGCVNARAIAVSKDDRYVAIGSGSGSVNVYDLTETWRTETPAPLKTLECLGQPNRLAFSPDGQLLAMGSSHADGSLRLVHLSSMTAFSNFPGPSMVRQRPSSLSFSVHGGFLAVGMDTGKVALFRLKYYPGY